MIGPLRDVGMGYIRMALLFTDNPRADYNFLGRFAARRGFQLRVVADEPTAEDFPLARAPRLRDETTAAARVQLHRGWILPSAWP